MERHGGIFCASICDEVRDMEAGIMAVYYRPIPRLDFCSVYSWLDFGAWSTDLTKG